MDEGKRRHLSRIGRKGGIRSRRELSSEQGRAMALTREARRAARRFAESAFARGDHSLPGSGVIAQGLVDLSMGTESEAALIVSIGAPRLRLLDIHVPVALGAPEMRLFRRLQVDYGDAAHSRYNAHIRRLVSFQRSAGALAHA